MIFFFIFLLIVCPWVFGLIKQYNSKKLNIFSIFSFSFGIFIFLLNPFFISFQLSFFIYKIFSWTIFAFLFIIIFLLFLFFIIKYKNDALTYIKDNYIFNCLISGSIFIFSIIMLFVRTNFSDTLAYINLSYSFKNDQMLSFDGINPIGISYKVSPLYYLNAVFFENEITASYQYFNPIVFFCSVSFLLNEYTQKMYLNNKANKFKLITLIILNLSLIAFCLVTTYFTTSGNLFIQSLILVFFIFNMKINSDLILSLLSTFIVTFYSATGLLNFSGICLGILIYSFFFCSFKKTLFLLFACLILASCFMPIFLYDNNFSILLFIIPSLLGLALILFLFFVNQVKLDRVILDCDRIKTKTFFWTFFAIFLIVSILNFTFFGFLYENKIFYEYHLSYLNLFTYLSLLLGFFVMWKKQKIDRTWIVIFIFSFASIFMMGIFYVLGYANNNSVWRVIFLNIALMPWINLILLIFYIITTFISIFDFSNKKLLNKLKNNAIIIYSLANFVIAIPFGIETNKKTPYNLFSTNITINLNNLDKNDISFLGKIKSKNDDKLKVVLDGPYFQYLNNAQNFSSLFYETNIFNSYHNLKSVMQTWLVNSYNFQWSIKTYNSLYPQNKCDFSDDFILEAFKTFLEYINLNKFNIDLIILNKSTTYFHKLFDFMQTNNTTQMIYQSNNICVYDIKNNNIFKKL